jgi:nicotinate-nucleotide adenylyltransferase
MADVQHSSPRRVGVFGGSFDPIHNGHVRIAQAACDAHELDQLVLVPASHQPHKSRAPRAPAADRMAMARLVAAEDPRFVTSDCELTRPAPSYTIDTLHQLREKFGPDIEWFLIVGADSLRDLPLWRSFPELVRLCTIVVAARPGHPFDGLDALAQHIDPQQVTAISEAALRDTAAEVSSTQIRDLAASGGRIDGLVPKCVADYVAQNKLYTSQ